MTTSPLTLTAFLLARFAEDEATARYELGDLMVDRPDAYSTLGGADPERVLAECEAKRRVVAVATEQINSSHGEPLVRIYRKTDAALILQALAGPYRDHPDCRDEWKPQ